MMAMCANCGQNNLVEIKFDANQNANGLSGYRHADQHWLCETCENRLMKLKGMAMEAFGLPSRREHWKNGKILSGWVR